jgi:hypothetical protein
MEKKNKQSKKLKNKIRKAEERTRQWALGQDVKFPEPE